MAPPFRTAEVDIIYGEGISREGDILDLAVAENIVNKSGAWYAYNGDKIGQGRENAKLFLKEHPDLMEEVEQKVREKYAQKEGVDQAENKFWSVREFGPLWVPAKNMTVVIDSASWIVYKALIEWEQKKKMHLKLNKVYLGDSLINAYCFMEDYYFVAGDNLPVSVDSRYWGVLPRSFIVGKVAFVWFTRRKETKNIEWKRMFLKM